MRSWLGITLGIAAVIVLGAIISCVYTIYPTDQVLLTRLGAPEAVITEPGLHFKIPFYQYANFMPRRLLTLEAASQEVIAADKKRLEVSTFAHWRIVDPLKFYQSVPNGDADRAGALLQPILSSSIRGVLGSETLAAVFSRKREKLMAAVRDAMNQETVGFGVVIEDVRIRHADLPPAAEEAIYARMQKEREREAGEYRAESDEAALRLKSGVERQAALILAEATRQAEILRGEGDAERARILSEAYGQDPEFFAFYRSMQAYRDALKGGTTTLVLSPDSEFLKYLGDGAAAARKRK
jgi:membrane protease subunit HflC